MRVSLSEWLRRLTRNQLGSARAGSNPAADDFLVLIFINYKATLLWQTQTTTKPKEKMSNRKNKRKHTTSNWPWLTLITNHWKDWFLIWAEKLTSKTKNKWKLNALDQAECLPKDLWSPPESLLVVMVPTHTITGKWESIKECSTYIVHRRISKVSSPH